MKPWLYRHRHPIYLAYMAVALTVTAVLQILQSTGHLP